MDPIDNLLNSRRDLPRLPGDPLRKEAGEGGCGVIGIASTLPIEGKHLLTACGQMRNRGNGKGGGICAAGLDPQALGVSRDILENDYLVQIAYLEPGLREEIEDKFLFPPFEVHAHSACESLSDFKEIPGLEVRPPTVWRYFVRVKKDVLAKFAEEKALTGLPADAAEDEFIYRHSYRFNHALYASLGDKKAFILSHGKNLLVFKMVGYAEDVVRFYRLEDFKAHIWIGHQRYPTKGRVWHPGGAHPFIGLHEALVHNGDFANYARVVKYLRQRNISPLFLTDTEVSVLLFDLWTRVYRYPMEHVIEALAPTTERDFTLLPAEKQKAYAAIQTSAIKGSPDGPWFFIIARSDPSAKQLQLIGITDTSMLRPQVFALQDTSLQAPRREEQKPQAPPPVPESSQTLEVAPPPPEPAPAPTQAPAPVPEGSQTLEVSAPPTESAPAQAPPPVLEGPQTPEAAPPPPEPAPEPPPVQGKIAFIASEKQAIDATLESLFAAGMPFRPPADLYWNARGGSHTDGGAFIFTLPYDGKDLKATDKFGREIAPSKTDYVIAASHRHCEEVKARIKNQAKVHLDFTTRHKLSGPAMHRDLLGVDASAFPVQGANSLSLFLAAAFRHKWRRVTAYNLRGHRFVGCGLGVGSQGRTPSPHGSQGIGAQGRTLSPHGSLGMGTQGRLDIYGSPGDYLASGLDGLEIRVHGSAQDQVGQVMKSGKLVVYGDVGQTFLYAAKGGETYVLGNAAGRPLINAVGKPRVVINGTALDYLAESFMAGDPLKGGGFVILNGIRLVRSGEFTELETPYPGGNLFSLASGGAIYVRDPEHLIGEDQLNGGRLCYLSSADWDVIGPVLDENERLFGIKVQALLTHKGHEYPPKAIYRKIVPTKLRALVMGDD